MKKWTKQFMELLVISVIFIISICSSKNMVFAKMEQNSTVEDSTINNATHNKDGYKNIEKYIEMIDEMGEKGFLYKQETLFKVTSTVDGIFEILEGNADD